jgi:CheY-like chemotaxis protein
MNVLLLEDTGAVAYPLRDKLETENHTVYVAQNIPKAKAYLRKEEIHCIIVDMNMPPEGLKDDEKKQTRCGIFSGWVWLQNYVFPENESMKKNTIILTAYAEELREHVGSDELSDIIIIEKGYTIEHNTDLLLQSIRNISKRWDNEKK